VIATTLLIACDQNDPTSQTGLELDRTAPASAAGGCGNQPGAPSGLIVDKVLTSPAWGIAVRDDGYTYFTAVFDGGLGITSTKTRKVDGFIPTGEIPTGVAFTPDGATAYVANQLSSNVGVIDVATSQQVTTISTGFANPFAVKVSPDGSRLFIATNGTIVYIVDTGTNQIIAEVSVGEAPNAFAVAPDNRILYVSAFVGGTVTEIDMFTETVLRTFFVGGTPQDMAVTRKGDRLYVANEAGYLNEITLQSGAVTATIPLSGGAFGIGVTANDAEAYVSIPFNGQVQVFKLQNRQLTRTIAVGGQPRRIGFSQQGAIGAIANLDGFITFVR
jgi:YVTN family beta-propeller protein